MIEVQPTFTLPTKAELGARVQRLREEMEQHGLDVYVSSQTDNVYYLTNFANYVHERPFVLLIGRDGPMRFVVPKLEHQHVHMRSIGDIDLVEYFEYPAPRGQRWSDRLAELIPHGAKVGIESSCPAYLSAALPQNTRAVDLIDDLRQIKSAFELARIQYASDLASEVHTRFLQTARPGLSLARQNSEVAGHVLGMLLAREPKLNLFATKVNFGFQPPSVSWDPHNFTDLSMTTEIGGPNVSLFNGILNGYGTEVERTFFLGHVPEAARRPFETMLEARHAALEAMRPGALMSEVDAKANSVMRQAGYRDNLLHRTGHGIGVTGHEGPFLAEGYDRVIEPGMVFTVEPGLYIEGLGGFRHSDTVRIGETGAILMTSGPVTLEELTIPC